MPSASNTLVLLGDSTIDNYCWVAQSEDSVTETVRKKLQETHEVVDLSCDGFTSNDVLNGALRNKAIKFDPVRHKEELFKPLEELQKQESPSHIVLSIGGNDFREELGKLINQKPEERTASIEQLTQGIQERYLKILDQIQAMHPDARPIIMLQYTPDSTHDLYAIYTLMSLVRSKSQLSLFGILKYLCWGKTHAASIESVKELHHLMEEVYKPILALAKEKHIPVIDMASSLDHRDTHFYNSQIEPSAAGSAVIANLISHVVNEHDFSDSSYIYSQPDANPGLIVSRDNHDSWKPQRFLPATQEEAKEIFLSEYKERLTKDKEAWRGCYSFFATSKVRDDMSFEEILSHAQSKNNRSWEVMQELEWLDNQNQLTLSLGN